MSVPFLDLPPPRQRPQTFSPSMEDLTQPYTKLGKAQSLKFRHSENELVDDVDYDAGKLSHLFSTHSVKANINQSRPIKLGRYGFK